MILKNSDENRTCAQSQCNIDTQISNKQEKISEHLPADTNSLQRSVNSKSREEQQPPKHTQRQSQQQSPQLLAKADPGFQPVNIHTNHDHFHNRYNNLREATAEKKSTESDVKHEPIDEASISEKTSSAKIPCEVDNNISIFNTEMAANSLTDFAAINLIQNPSNLVVKEASFDEDGSNYLHPVLQRNKTELSAFRRPFSLISVASSTVSTISSGCKEEILNQFAYDDLLKRESCVSIYSSSSDCSGNLLRTVILQDKKKSSARKKKLFRRITKSSTISAKTDVMSNGCDDEILNRFLYNDFATYKNFVDISSPCSDCSTISQKSGLFDELSTSRRSTSTLPAINDIRETTEAHSTILTPTLNKKKQRNMLRSADISETTLVNKRGTIYIGGCKLDFPEGSFEKPVYVKLNCFFPLQAICDDGIVVSPEVEIEFEDQLTTFCSLTVPTCYSSTDGEDPAQITTQFCDDDGNWKTLDVEASFCCEHEHGHQLNMSIKFENIKTRRLRCIVTDSERPKLSKNMVSTCYLKASENSEQFGIVWYLVDEWEHLKSRVRLEMMPDIVYKHVFDKNVSDVKYGTELYLSMEEDKSTGGQTVVVESETIGKLLVFKKTKCDLESSKNVRFVIEDNFNKVILDRVEQLGARQLSGSFPNVVTKRRDLQRSGSMTDTYSKRSKRRQSSLMTRIYVGLPLPKNWSKKPKVHSSQKALKKRQAPTVLALGDGLKQARLHHFLPAGLLHLISPMNMAARYLIGAK